jgi:hypothetical protein
VKNKAVVTTNNWAYNNGMPVAMIFFVECNNNQLYCMITHGNASGTSLYSLLLLYCGYCSRYCLTEQDRTLRSPMPFVNRTRCKALPILIINIYVRNFLGKLPLNENDILSALRNHYTVSKVFVSGSPSFSSAAFIVFPLVLFLIFK